MRDHQHDHRVFNEYTVVRHPDVSQCLRRRFYMYLFVFIIFSVGTSSEKTKKKKNNLFHEVTNGRCETNESRMMNDGKWRYNIGNKLFIFESIQILYCSRVGSGVRATGTYILSEYHELRGTVDIILLKLLVYNICVLRRRFDDGATKEKDWWNSAVQSFRFTHFVCVHYNRQWCSILLRRYFYTDVTIQY